MPRSITIRGVPDEVVNELAARAARGGRSLQEYLQRELAHLTSRPDVEEFWLRVEHRKERMDSRLDTETILMARDADRR